MLYPDRPNVLALGGHWKNAIALSCYGQIVLSQHVGDLDTPVAIARLHATIDDLCALYGVEPEAIACDAHPDYATSRIARQLAAARGLPLFPVQHHYAHALACLADRRLDPPVCAIAWDGTGYGLDGTIWGGEVLVILPDGWRRIAHLRSFPLPGGDAAMREPRRAALGLLHESLGEGMWALDLPPLQAFAPAELSLLRGMLARQLNSPRTSSVGRLFDGMASILGLYQTCTFEGQAAIALEAAARSVPAAIGYPFHMTERGEIDWRPCLLAMLEARAGGVPLPAMAASFHQTLADIVVAVVSGAGERLGHLPVVLTGGCWQNRDLTERAIAALQGAGYQPFIHGRVPPNDGGLAVGQVLAVWRAWQRDVLGSTGRNSER